MRPLLVTLALLALAAAPAQAELGGPSVPPPAGCTPSTIAEALAAPAGAVCVHRVLVTETVNTGEQNHTDLTVTDHRGELHATFANWWPQGPPQAGMILTLWGHMNAGKLVVDRWIDLAHGSGPGTYPLVSELDVDRGLVPNNRTVWVPAVVFALDPQDGGDGDVHVQTFWPCPAAGLTTESTPALRGYVDHPQIPGLTSSTDTGDEPSSHLADDPPIGVPVLILGQIRVDYGFGWYELHPIRAWRPMTPEELAAAGAQCAADPAPKLDAGPTYGGHQVPVPFGVPPCTDGSEFGSPPGFGPCLKTYCYVSRTAIGRPEQLAGDDCDRITPLVTPSQEGLPESLPGGGAMASALPPAVAEDGGDALEAEAERFRTPASPLLAAYGPSCRAAGVARGGRRACAEALAHLASGEQISPRAVCRGRARCARAGRLMLRRLAASRGR